VALAPPETLPASPALVFLVVPVEISVDERTGMEDIERDDRTPARGATVGGRQGERPREPAG
jgi:hypothetical protein